MFETTEGLMELDFEKMELYVQRGDLCWPMLRVGNRHFTPFGTWVATCPMTGRQLWITQSWIGCKTGHCCYLVSLTNGGPPIGYTEEYNLDR